MSTAPSIPPTPAAPSASPLTAAACVRLAELTPGSRAEVESVDGGPLARRLLDLGFVPRTQVLVVRRAPLGDPTEYELRGTRLCLRRAEAARVRVRPVAPAAA